MIDLAIATNVDWCDRVCRAHGCDPTIADGVWATPTRSPDLYPDAITLARGAGDLRSRIDARPGATVKDSYADLDLPAFEVLFEATWIGREAAPPDAGSWNEVDLHDLGLPASAGGDDVAALALVVRGRVVGTAVANRAAGAVGVSNVSGDGVWPGLAAAVAHRFGPLPVLGYERGGDLRSALAAGFAPIGPLRVLVAR